MCTVQIYHLWPTGKGRIEGGITSKQKGLWDRPGVGRIVWNMKENRSIKEIISHVAEFRLQ